MFGGLKKSAIIGINEKTVPAEAKEAGGALEAEPWSWDLICREWLITEGFEAEYHGQSLD